jgi:hypothetical protein
VKKARSVKTCFCLGLFMACLSQQARSQFAHHLQPITVKGSEHPDQIPDSLAWLLYLGTVSEPPNATESDRARQRAKLSAAHLTEKDLAQAARLLGEFHLKSKDIENRLAKAVQQWESVGTPIDENAFLAERQALVSNTRSTFRDALTSSGMANLEAQIREEKQFMTAVFDPDSGGQAKRHSDFNA